MLLVVITPICGMSRNTRWMMLGAVVTMPEGIVNRPLRVLPKNESGMERFSGISPIIRCPHQVPQKVLCTASSGSGAAANCRSLPDQVKGSCQRLFSVFSTP